MTQDHDREPADLVAELAQVAADLGPALAVPEADALLASVCATARLAFGAAACSVAEADEEAWELRYRASDGAGAEEVLGMVIPMETGLAGFVATSGLALSVEEPDADPRFARDVAERTGYVPSAILSVPLVDGAGDVLGVFSVLDRDESLVPADRALDLATRFAEQASLALRIGRATRTMGTVLLDAVAAAVDEGDQDLAAALRRQAEDRRSPHRDVAAIAARLAELRVLAPAMATTAGKVLDELLDYAEASRGRRR
ncbi:MAG: GAF domain-containing protein [Acidimicrobiales bacterium]